VELRRFRHVAVMIVAAAPTASREVLSFPTEARRPSARLGAAGDHGDPGRMSVQSCQAEPGWAMLPPI
jgi:hypothetical protein